MSKESRRVNYTLYYFLLVYDLLMTVWVSTYLFMYVSDHGIVHSSAEPPTRQVWHMGS
jgi:hypothetical protein